jgi:hypothetical protein
MGSALKQPIMERKVLSYLNLALLSLIVLFSLAAAALFLVRPANIVIEAPTTLTKALPPNSFGRAQVSYDAIDRSCLSLQFHPPTLHLPDLRSQLTYYGANGRPDASTNRTLMHFAITASKSHTAVAPDERRYIYYDKKQVPGRYLFSPDNAETSLWISAANQGSEATVTVSMLNEHGQEIHEPEQCSQFLLQEKEFARFSNNTNWEIGGHRVDGTLLARQHARWCGPDCFLENHGGDEFLNCIGGQRIDFGEEENIYSCYVKQGDCLIWDGDRWKNIQNGESTSGYPLLHVKKIDDRLTHLELWDVEGKSKVALNLMKANEPWTLAAIEQTFKFVGARTRTQCVCEVDQARMLLKPNDWLILTDEGWKKITTVEEIDNYVNRKLIGPLFVFEGLAKKDERPVLLGTVYNASRTEARTVELAVQQSNVTIIPNKNNSDRVKDDPNHQPPPIAKNFYKR